jgi:hypothetical protein
MNVKVV